MTLEIVVALVGLTSIIASGSALYVSMKIKGELSAFRVEFMRELDERYLRSKEYAKDTVAVAAEERQYRLDTKERVGAVEVEVVKVRDSSNELREIVIRMHPNRKRQP